MGNDRLSLPHRDALSESRVSFGRRPERGWLSHRWSFLPRQSNPPPPPLGSYISQCPALAHGARGGDGRCWWAAQTPPPRSPPPRHPSDGNTPLLSSGQGWTGRNELKATDETHPFGLDRLSPLVTVAMEDERGPPGRGERERAAVQGPRRRG